MTFKNRYVCGVVLTLGFLVENLAAHAVTFNAGQALPGNTFTPDGYGQSFVPNKQLIFVPGSGNIAPTSGDVNLNAFSFVINASFFSGPTENIGSQTLYIYSSIPTLTQLSNGTNALYASTIFTDSNAGGRAQFARRTWIFSNAVLDANTTYFALFPTPTPLRIDLGGGGGYPFGGLVSDVNRNNTLVPTPDDTNFVGSYSTTATPVPFEFSPALGVGALGGLLAAKKLSSKFLTKK